MAGPIFDNIPEELKERNHWVLWKTITRAGKLRKVPYDTTGREGDSSDPARWEPYTDVVEAYQKGGYDGIGYVFDVLDPYAGIDLDHCITDTGSIKPKAKEILDTLNSYPEISPSETGIKAIVKAKNPVNIRKKDGKFQQGFKSEKPDLEIEIYYGDRFFTLTGDRLPDYPATIENRSDELTGIFKDVFKDRGYFGNDGNDVITIANTTDEPLSSDAAERLQELFAADPTFKSDLTTPAPIGKRSDAEFHFCARLWEAGFDESEIYHIMTSSPQSKWQERTGSYRWDTIKGAVAKAEASHMERVKEADARQILRHLDSEELTEGGNAQRLERQHGDELRFNHTLKKWYIWDGGRWKVDANGGAMRYAGYVVGELYRAAGDADGEERKKLLSFATATDSRKGLTNMLALAANRLTFALTAEDFDKDPWLLGAGDVTVDLKSGTTRESSQADLITKTIGTEYDRSAGCPLWDAFLIKIFPEEDLRKYIQKAVGYCLTGSMAEQVFFFCYGMGANGKSVFLAILRALLGEYAKQADFSTFLVQRNEKVRNDLAALAGARVITAIEAEEGGRLSMQVIKSWTGGDPITARFLFGENFTFRPVGKIWLAANNKPAITERNLAAWRRVRLIPFNVTISEAEQDKELESKLLDELPGILNWALDGLKEYREQGLKAPQAVSDATNEYRMENDSLEQFVTECCDVGKLKTCKNSELYGAYLNFCGMSGLKVLSQTKFSPELSIRPGISSTRTMHGITWIGIDLKKNWKPCRVEDNPTSQAVAAKHEGLEEIAQPSLNSPSREILAQKPTYHTYPTSNEALDSDSLESKPYIDLKGSGCMSKVDRPIPEKKIKDDPGLLQFKAGIRKYKHVCRLCGQHFEQPLVIAGYGGHICARCHREGPPAPAKQADPQTTLADS